MLVTSPIAYLIYRFEEPPYEAVSLLRFEPPGAPIDGPTSHSAPNQAESRPYLRTQLQLIRSDQVLNSAPADPAISRLPMVRSSRDPGAHLRKEMRVRAIAARRDDRPNPAA